MHNPLYDSLSPLDSIHQIARRDLLPGVSITIHQPLPPRTIVAVIVSNAHFVAFVAHGHQAAVDVIRTGNELSDAIARNLFPKLFEFGFTQHELT